MSCPKCVEGHVLPGEPTGSFPGGFQGAYLAPGPSETDHGKRRRAVVLLTDAFGLALPNPKIMADTLAARLQCDVWVPDYFDGRPLVPRGDLLTPERAEQTMSLYDWVRFVVKFIPNIPAFISSRPSVVDRRVSSFLALLKEKNHYANVGAVGYCYGGATCVRLASTGLVDGVVICHPGPFSSAEVRAMKTPSSWVCAEADFSFSEATRLQTEAELAGRKGTEREVAYEFNVYKGTAHGFASRPNPDFADIMDRHREAIDQKVAWFEKTLRLDDDSEIPHSLPPLVQVDGLNVNM